MFALWRRRRLQIAIIVILLTWACGTGWFTTPLLGLAQNGYLESREPQFRPDTTIVLMGGGTNKTDSGLVPKRDSMARIAVTATLSSAGRPARSAA